MRFNQFIGGEWATSNDISANTNQSNTADIIGEFARGSVEEVDIAVAAARAAQPVWAVANDTEFGLSSGHLCNFSSVCHSFPQTFKSRYDYGQFANCRCGLSCPVWRPQRVKLWAPRTGELCL